MSSSKVSDEGDTYLFSVLQHGDEQSDVLGGRFECVHFAGLVVRPHQGHHALQAGEHGVQVPDLMGLKRTKWSTKMLQEEEEERETSIGPGIWMYFEETSLKSRLVDSQALVYAEVPAGYFRCEMLSTTCVCVWPT